MAVSFAIFLLFLEIFYPINLNKAKDTSRVIYDRDGKILYTTLNSNDKWRFRVDLKKVDPLYKKMLINYEDKRFYRHFGVDILALSRATYQLISSGHIKSGGSTITMQLARLLEPKSRTFSSKIVEIFRSIQIEMHYSKDEILSAYLTLAPYGGNREGVVSASLKYFGKSPNSLTPSQAALLTAIPKNPELNYPRANSNRAKKVRDIVLKEALKSKIIDNNSYNFAIGSKVNKKLYNYPRFAPHLSMKLLKLKPKEIKSTIYLPLQDALEKWAKTVGERLPKDVSLSTIVIDNTNGDVIAYIGSYNIFSKKVAGYIDMLQAIRSPGSVLKPLIYNMAIQKHIIDTNTIIYDKESQFGEYHPHNFNRKYNAEVSAASALINSLNIPAIKVLERIGPQKFIDELKAVAPSTIVPKGKATLPVALGGIGIKPIDVAQLYSIIANGGKGRQLHFIYGQKGKRLTIQNSLSLKKITNILREVPPPKGYRNPFGFFAYKTGTSYGYRDFWSAIYSKRYTALVLIAKPNNKPIFKSSARAEVAPLSFEVMSYVKNILPHNSWQEDSHKTTNQAPPPSLKYLNEPKKEESQFDFLYPKNLQRFQSASCQDAVVSFKLKGGKNPYIWYIDGKLNKASTNSINIKLSAGSHTISAIEAQGKQALRDIWVDAPECQE